MTHHLRTFCHLYSTWVFHFHFCDFTKRKIYSRYFFRNVFVDMKPPLTRNSARQWTFQNTHPTFWLRDEIETTAYLFLTKAKILRVSDILSDIRYKNCQIWTHNPIFAVFQHREYRIPCPLFAIKTANIGCKIRYSRYFNTANIGYLVRYSR